VHEGFTIAAVINTFTQLMKNSPDIIILTFDVSPYASLDVLGKFLHHLYVFGLLIDEETGQVSAFDPRLTYFIFIELPALSFFAESEGQVDVEWPTDMTLQTINHPYLAKLPVLSLAVQTKNYIFIDFDSPYRLSLEARLVASYWFLHSTLGLDKVPQLPTCPLESLSDEDLGDRLFEFFSTYRLNGSKREQTNVLKLLNERLLYLAQLHAAAQAENLQLLVNPEIFTFYERFEDHFDAIFRLLVKESVDIGSDSSSTQVFAPHETFVSSIRPAWEENGDELSSMALFEILLCSKTCSTRIISRTCPFCFFEEESQRTFYCNRCLGSSDEIQEAYVPLKDLYPHAQILNLAEGQLSGEIRALIAPVFGMKNTSRLCETLVDMGHIFTPESLVRILYLHEKRKLASFVIFEGETGCGMCSLIFFPTLIFFFREK
jgi:hypothetical protein